MSGPPQKRNGFRADGFEVNGYYYSTRAKHSQAFYSLSLEERQSTKQREMKLDFEFRNAELRSRDSSSSDPGGEQLDIRVWSFTKKDNEGYFVFTDWLVLHSPAVRFHEGMVWIDGFVHVYQLGGERKSDFLDGRSEPMQRAHFMLRPEGGIDAAGNWLKDIKPEKQPAPTKRVPNNKPKRTR